MKPVFVYGPRGKSVVRLKNVFWCPDGHTMAHGRRKTSYLTLSA